MYFALADCTDGTNRKSRNKAYIRFGYLVCSLVDLESFDIDGMVEDNIQLLDDNEWDAILEEYPDYENEI